MLSETDIYKTIASPSEGLYKEKGSRFLSFAFPVYDENSIKEHLKNLRKEYNDARHHCYAYRLGHDKILHRMTDDGEPSGTAGKPIYGQILSSGLTFIVIFVIRYFGGTLLGTGRLTVAYKEAAFNAIKNATIIECYIKNRYNLTFQYTMMNSIMKIIKEEELENDEHHFTEPCSLVISIRKRDTERIINQLSRIDSLKIDYLYTI